MNTFTYKNYIDVIHTLRLNAVLQLAESSTSYQLQVSNSHNKHDKLVKNILRNTEEMANFLNQFLNLNTFIRPAQLVRYTNSYITKKYKNKEADLVYYLKSSNVFFLVEHQSTIDNHIAFRMLNYCIDIMQEYIKNKKTGRNISYPIIIPILIYTGTEKWKIPTNFEEKQIADYVFDNYKINFSYNVINIPKYSKQVLLSRKSLFSYAMLLEKAQTKQELQNALEQLIEIIDRTDYLEELSDILYYLLSDSLEESVQIELLEKIDRKVGGKNMSTLYDRLVEENIRMIRKGRRDVAKKMVKKRVDDDFILEVTGITEDDLKKLKIKYKVI